MAWHAGILTTTHERTLMTDAAQTHLAQVKEATSHAEMLKAAIEAYRNGVTDAVTKIGAALDELADQAAAAAAAADNALAPTGQTTQTGEAYLEATTYAGDGTIGLARASKEASDMAYATLQGVQDLIDTVNGAVATAKNETTTIILACGSTVETITEGANVTTGHLADAQAKVEQAINPVT